MMERVKRKRKVEGKRVKGIDILNGKESKMIGELENEKLNIDGVRREDIEKLLE